MSLLLDKPARWRKRAEEVPPRSPAQDARHRHRLARHDRLLAKGSQAGLMIPQGAQGPEAFRSPGSTITAPSSSHCPRWCFTCATSSIASLCLLKQARYRPTPGGARSISSSAACVTKTATSVEPWSIENRTPRMVSYAGLPTDERLIGSLLTARCNLRLDGCPFLHAAQEFLFSHRVDSRVARLTVASKDGAILTRRHWGSCPLGLINLDLLLN